MYCLGSHACLCAVIVRVDAAAQTADEVEPVQPRVNGLHRWVAPIGGRMEAIHK